jgi:thiol-disulfide isomerase/thioredoxin
MYIFQSKKCSFINLFYTFDFLKITIMPNKSFLILSLVLVFHTSIFGQTSSKVENGLLWYTSLQEAHELSLKSKKPIFAFFTGSDWCGWCKRLQANVFSKQAFIDWAKNDVILLELDFPRGKALSPELSNQNYNKHLELGDIRQFGYFIQRKLRGLIP